MDDSAPRAEEGAAKQLSSKTSISHWRGCWKSNDGLAGFQHLDSLVRGQDLTGHPGHQWVSTTQMFHVKHILLDALLV